MPQTPPDVSTTTGGGFGLLITKFGLILFGFILGLSILSFLIFFICFTVFSRKNKNLQPSERGSSKSKNIRLGLGISNVMLYVSGYLGLVSLIFIDAFDIRSPDKIKNSSTLFILIFWVAFFSVFLGFLILLVQRFKDMVKNVKNPPKNFEEQKESNKKLNQQIGGLVALGIGIPLTGLFLIYAYP